MRLVSILAAAFFVVPAAAQTAPSVWYKAEPAEVANIIANVCVDRGSIVVEQDNYHVLCTRQASGVKGAIAQALMGNSYSTVPELHVRFAIMKDGKSTRVQASQWVQTQMAYGQIRRQPLDGKKQNADLANVLIANGALASKPADEAPTPDVAP